MSDQVDSIMADFLSDTSDAFMREIGDTESTGCDRVSESCDAYIPSPPGQETGVCDTGLGRIDLDGILVDLFSDIEGPVECDSGVMDQMLSCLPIVGREEDTNMVLDSVKSCVPVPDPSTTPSTHTAEHQCSTAVMQQMPSCLSPEPRRVDVSRGNGLTGDTSHQSLTLNPSSTPPQNTQLVESATAQVLSSPVPTYDPAPQSYNLLNSETQQFYRPWQSNNTQEMFRPWQVGGGRRVTRASARQDAQSRDNNLPPTSNPPTTQSQEQYNNSTPSTSSRITHPTPTTSAGRSEPQDPFINPVPSTSSGVTHQPQGDPNFRPAQKRKAEKQITSAVDKTRRVASPNDSITSGFRNRQWFVRFPYGGDTDIIRCLNAIKEKILRDLTWYYYTTGQCKYYFTINITFAKELPDGSTEYLNHELNSTAIRLLLISDFPDAYDTNMSTIIRNCETFMERGSGWTLHSINHVTLNILKYEPIRGSSYLPTPACIAKEFIVNPKNTDDQNCFLYAVLAKLKWKTEDTNRSYYKTKYKPYLHELNYEGMSMPMNIEKISKFEQLNNLSINVYSVPDKGSSEIRPLRISNRSQEDPINLLLIVGDDTNHYTWISNLDRMLNKRGKQQKRHCPRCLHGFDVRTCSKERLADHVKTCSKMDAVAVKYPKYKVIKFDRIGAMLPAPLTISADFEATQRSVNQQHGNTTLDTEHQISGFSIQPVSRIGAFKFDDEIKYSGEGAIKKFFHELKVLALAMEEIYNECCDKEMVMTPPDWKSFKRSRECYLCGEEFSCQLPYKDWQNEMKNIKEERERIEEETGEQMIEDNDDPYVKGPKVRDHDHWTGTYRGAAHAVCNLKLKPNFRIPVFFHNLSGQ